MQDQLNKVGDTHPLVGDAIGAIAAKTAKQKVQLSFADIHITAIPAEGRCKPKNTLKEPKKIIRGVSGTIMPGQFVAIIGASGK